jgi:hypothetical protein
MSICYCPDKVTGLVLALLGFPITKLPSEVGNQMMAWAVDSKTMGDTAWTIREVGLKS